MSSPLARITFEGVIDGLKKKNPQMTTDELHEKAKALVKTKANHAEEKLINDSEQRDEDPSETFISRVSYDYELLNIFRILTIII